MTYQYGFLCCIILILLHFQWTVSTETKKDSCVKFNLDVLWSSGLRDSPLISSPLLLDIDGDGYRDILVSSTSGEFWALHGENGHVVDNWPFYLEDRSFFASPLSYDFNKDGVMDIALITTDAELLFIKTDNTLFYGETIKIPPLRVKKDWYKLDESYVANLIQELKQQVGDERFIYEKVPGTTTKLPMDTVFSRSELNEPEKDPLFSRYQLGKRPSGIDPTDDSFIFVDSHVLATPVLADLDEDGLEDELVVPVSYFFDSRYYGAHKEEMNQLGIDQEELINYAAGAIVIINLRSGRVIKQKLLTLTRINSDQPGYLLASPTVARLAVNDPMSIIVGTASGELHFLYGLRLESAGGYPLTMDSVTSQAAVEDITGDGVMEIVVGDRSGNVYCLNRLGQKIWEQETSQPIDSSVRFVKFQDSYSMEVVIITSAGAVWVLNGSTGAAVRNSPISLNSPVSSSPLLIHLPSPDLKEESSSSHLTAVVPSMSGLFVVDLVTGCVNHASSDHVLYMVQSDHIDPFNTGLEILATSLNGHLVCYSTGVVHPPSDYELSMETWPSDTLNQNGFTHKSSSFVVSTDHSVATREETGSSFDLQFFLHDGKASIQNPKRYTVLLTVGRRYTLFNETITARNSSTFWQFTIDTPPSPMHSAMMLRVCNDHIQCDSATFNVRFNMAFHDVLKWCLSLPFFGLVAGYLWLLRNESTSSLPTTTLDNRKFL